MNILAIDTATECCSAALLRGQRCIERAQQTARAHAELILPMVDALLQEGGLTLQQLDGIAYGRGPGAFTGVRIAVAVAQGLAYGAQRPTVGISDLAAVAEQVARASARPGDRLLVCMDARMGEVYWGAFEHVQERAQAAPRTIALGPERVGAPEAVIAAEAGARAAVCAGTGFKAYPQLLQLAQAQRPDSERLDQPPESPGAPARVLDAVLPHAREIALLARAELLAGRGRPAAEAQPVYLRDQVAWPRQT